MGWRSLLALSAVVMACAIWLLTADVYVDDGNATSFCGSAYDVVLLKGDGFMGGEVPQNQPVLDQECVRKAGWAVALGSFLVAAAIAVAGCAMARLRSSRRLTSAGGT